LPEAAVKRCFPCRTDELRIGIPDALCARGNALSRSFIPREE
jgi:hypothetical protein